MPAWHDQHQFVLAVGQHLQIVPFARHARVADAQVRCALLHRANDFGTQVFFEIDLDLAMLAHEAAQIFRQELHDG